MVLLVLHRFPAFHTWAGRASINTGRFRVGGSRCWPRLARLRETCYHPCCTDLARVKKSFNDLYVSGRDTSSFSSLGGRPAAPRPTSLPSASAAHTCLPLPSSPARLRVPRPCEFTDPERDPPSPPRLAGTAGHHPAARRGRRHERNWSRRLRRA